MECTDYGREHDVIAKKLATRLGVGVAALALAGFASSAEAAPAAPSSFRCNSVNWFCLYYGENHTGAGFGYPHADAYVYDLNNYRYPTNDGAGSGQIVGNNSESAEDASDCNVGVWYSRGFTGNSDWLRPWTGANLSATYDNDRSIAVLDAACPHTGIYGKFGH
ncbi:hypothetical protein AAW14_01155 [Streptomyces hygroscopicus]|nr:hypothetical protein [Streptomyces hygroscopicus]